MRHKLIRLAGVVSVCSLSVSSCASAPADPVSGNSGPSSRVSTSATPISRVPTSAAPTSAAVPAPALTTVPPTTAAAVRTLAGLGDSIPAGDNCPGCATFVDLFGQELARLAGNQVDVHNLGIGGWTTADLLDSLRPGSVDAATVQNADVVTVTIGANDFYPQLQTYLAGSCPGLECFAPVLTDLQGTLTAVLARIAELRAGRHAQVLVTGYWDIFPDGDVAQALYGRNFLADSAAVSRQADDVIRSVATATGARYVDLYSAFRGPDGTADTTGLLSDDGDHPNQDGHRVIAAALAASLATTPAG